MTNTEQDHHNEESNQNLFDKLPDEVILDVLVYCTNDPIGLVRLSHVNKRMEMILNRNPNVVSQMITYTSTHGSIRRGFSICKLCQNPIVNGLSLFKNVSVISERNLDLRKYVDSKQKIVDCLKYSRLDPIKTIRKIESWINQFERNHMAKLFYCIFLIFSLTAQFILGTIGNTPPDKWSLEEGLWWLPYAFWSYEGIMLGGIVITLLILLFYFVKSVRSLIVNPEKKNGSVEKSIAILIFLAQQLLYSYLFSLFILLVRAVVYNSLDIELSSSESTAYKLFYYSHYPILLLLVLLGFTTNSIDIVGTVIGLSLFKFTGNLLSFIPISLSLCFISIKEIIYEIKYHYLALSLSAFFISFGHFSYLTLAPISLLFVRWFVESLES